MREILKTKEKFQTEVSICKLFTRGVKINVLGLYGDLCSWAVAHKDQKLSEMEEHQIKRSEARKHLEAQ